MQYGQFLKSVGYACSTFVCGYPAIPGSVGRCLIHWATGPLLSVVLRVWSFCAIVFIAIWGPCLRAWCGAASCMCVCFHSSVGYGVRPLTSRSGVQASLGALLLMLVCCVGDCVLRVGCAEGLCGMVAADGLALIVIRS